MMQWFPAANIRVDRMEVRVQGEKEAQMEIKYSKRRESMLTSVSPMMCCELKGFFLSSRKIWFVLFINLSEIMLVQFANLFLIRIIIHLIFNILLLSIHCSPLSIYIYKMYIIYIHPHIHIWYYFPDPSVQGIKLMNDMPQDKHLEEALGSEDKHKAKCNRCRY